MPYADLQPPDAHPVALLLPWYVTGTLNNRERREADEHLVRCPSCCSELALVRTLRSLLLAARTRTVSGPPAERARP